jgi:hypothetical protein
LFSQFSFAGVSLINMLFSQVSYKETSLISCVLLFELSCLYRIIDTTDVDLCIIKIHLIYASTINSPLSRQHRKVLEIFMPSLVFGILAKTGGIFYDENPAWSRKSVGGWKYKWHPKRVPRLMWPSLLSSNVLFCLFCNIQ